MPHHTDLAASHDWRGAGEGGQILAVESNKIEHSPGHDVGSKPCVEYGGFRLTWQVDLVYKVSADIPPDPRPEQERPKKGMFKNLIAQPYVKMEAHTKHLVFDYRGVLRKMVDTDSAPEYFKLDRQTRETKIDPHRSAEPYHVYNECVLWSTVRIELSLWTLFVAAMGPWLEDLADIYRLGSGTKQVLRYQGALGEVVIDSGKGAWGASSIPQAPRGSVWKKFPGYAGSHEYSMHVEHCHGPMPGHVTPDAIGGLAQVTVPHGFPQSASQSPAGFHAALTEAPQGGADRPRASLLPRQLPELNKPIELDVS